jgi:hypothetical protein
MTRVFRKAEETATFCKLYAALKRCSSTVAEGDGIAGGLFAGGRDSRFLSGFAGSE